MALTIPGIHHITAICGPPQDNVDYYVGTLGQRLVKKTVNFDDPGTYHLYYGDRSGSPGTIMTFFPFADAGPGRAGVGMASAFAYRTTRAGVDTWMARMADAGADFDGPAVRFGEPVIALSDPDGLRVELIGTDGAGDGDALDSGFHSITLTVAEAGPTAAVLTGILGFAEIGAEDAAGGQRIRFASEEGAGAIVDLFVPDAGAAAYGRPGKGTIHHVALRARSDAEQLEWRARVSAAGQPVTPVIDRQYFNAIYFREPGGVLFEIATDPPGFAIDEPPEALGDALKLPPRYEANRAAIEARLPPIAAPS